MFSLREYRQPTHRLPDLLPWAALVDQGTILQKDGLLQKTLAFRGPNLASSSPSELVSGIARLNNALRRLGSGWSLLSRRSAGPPTNTRPPCGRTRSPGSSTWSVGRRSSARVPASSPITS